MPWGDGTGPAGLGAMTGRAAGFCAGYSTPGYMNPYISRGGGFGRGFGLGRGFGRGFGRGLGFRRGFGGGFYGYPPYYAGGYSTPYAGGYSIPYNPSGAGIISSKQELEMLKGQSEVLEDQMDGIKKRIQELEKEKKEK